MNNDIKPGDNGVVIAVKCCSHKQVDGFGTVFKVATITPVNHKFLLITKMLGMGGSCKGCGSDWMPSALVEGFRSDGSGNIVVPIECVSKLPDIKEEHEDKIEEGLTA
jgi:hypothetical protein